MYPHHNIHPHYHHNYFRGLFDLLGWRCQALLRHSITSATFYFKMYLKIIQTSYETYFSRKDWFPIYQR